jgi:hypothetical protein
MIPDSIPTTFPNKTPVFQQVDIVELVVSCSPSSRPGSTNFGRRVSIVQHHERFIVHL